MRATDSRLLALLERRLAYSFRFLRGRPSDRQERYLEHLLRERDRETSRLYRPGAT